MFYFGECVRTSDGSRAFQCKIFKLLLLSFSFAPSIPTRSTSWNAVQRTLMERLRYTRLWTFPVPWAGRNGAYVMRKSRTDSRIQLDPRLLKFSIPVKNSSTIRSDVTSLVSAITSGCVRKRAVVCWRSPSGVVRLNAMSMVAYHFIEMCDRMAASRWCRTSFVLWRTYS